MMDLSLNVGIRLRNPLMLAKVLGPGHNKKPFNEALRILGVFKHAPSVSPIAAALLGQPVKRRQES
jgi:hypothetical protein